VQDLRVTLRGDVVRNLKEHKFECGEPVDLPPFYQQSVQFLANETLERSQTFPIKFNLHKSAFDTYDGSYISIRWVLEASFDPLSFFGGRQIKRTNVIVRSRPSPECKKQQVILPVKIERLIFFVKLDNIQCSISKPFTGQFVVERTDDKIKRKRFKTSKIRGADKNLRNFTIFS
jgi:hypothetical protein